MIASAPILSTEAVRCAGLQDVHIAIREKSLTLLFGPPACGKTPLLRTLGLLELPEAGEVCYRGKPTRALPEAERAALRNRHFGFVFAEPYLLPSFTVMENVAMPFFRISGVDTEEAQKRTRDVLAFVNLPGREVAAVQDLSRGEQQRVSLARALVNRTEIVLIEALDGIPEEESGASPEMLRRAVDQFGVSFIVTASTSALAGAMDDTFEIAGGHVRQFQRAGGLVV